MAAASLLQASTPVAVYGATQTVVTVEEDDGHAEGQGDEMRATCTFLPPSSEEYRMVAERFVNSLERSWVVIDRIAKVHNPALLDQYRRKREEMTKRNPKDVINEQLLFHGTYSHNIDSICCKGFEPTLAGTVNGKMFGQGSYFTARSDKAMTYSIRPAPKRYFPRLLGSATRPYRPKAVTAASLDLPPGEKAARMRGERGHVLLCSVLTGRTVMGEHTDTQPPLINPDQPELGRYDTCCKDELTLSTMVVFKKDQVYPSYVIEFEFTYKKFVTAITLIVMLLMVVVIVTVGQVYSSYLQ